MPVPRKAVAEKAVGGIVAAGVAPVARVLVDTPLPHLDRPFDYLVPAGMDADAVAGCRVRVRFAGKLTDGFLLERVESSEHEGGLLALERVVSAEPVLTPEIASLCRAVADRYAGTMSDVVRLAVPPRHARVEAEPVESEGTLGKGRPGEGAAAVGRVGEGEPGGAGPVGQGVPGSDEAGTVSRGGMPAPGEERASASGVTMGAAEAGGTVHPEGAWAEYHAVGTPASGGEGVSGAGGDVMSGVGGETASESGAEGVSGPGAEAATGAGRGGVSGPQGTVVTGSVEEEASGSRREGASGSNEDVASGFEGDGVSRGGGAV
ncbi:hypothetical protein ABGB17_38785, partial [Sphaerisporangium sp. B11E5]